MNEKLVRAAIRQTGGIERFNDNFQDIARHGIAGGYGGWIYYSETVKFFKSNRTLIIEYVEDLAEQLDTNVIDLVKNFKCLNDNYSVSEIGQALYNPRTKIEGVDCVYNTLAWVIIEELANFADNYTYENN